MAEELKTQFHCKDVTKENDPDCWSHMEWAIKEGEDAHPEWYPPGSTKSAVDVQCSLFIMHEDSVVGNGHNCTLPPCTAISAELSESGGAKVAACKPPLVKEEVQGPSIEWWGWVLIVAAILALATGIAYAMGFFSKKPKSKTRRVPLKQDPPAEPEPVPTVVTTVPIYTAPPVYTYTSAPVYEATQSIAVAAPSVVTAAPTSVLASSVSIAAAPVVSTVSAPLTQ